jgi:hypothetical protein
MVSAVGLFLTRVSNTEVKILGYPLAFTLVKWWHGSDILNIWRRICFLSHWFVIWQAASVVVDQQAAEGKDTYFPGKFEVIPVCES